MNRREVVESFEDNLARLGLELPKHAPKPIGAFRNVRVSRGYVYVSGQGPVDENGELKTGKVGDTVSTSDAQKHAKLVALNILAAVREELGSLDKIDGLVKLTGLVNSTPEFSDHPCIIDEASNLFGNVFGESGNHARTSYGVGSLPNQITVEIDAIFELRDSVT